MTHQEFIDTLVPLIDKYRKQYNYPFTSPILAQAILESSWGTSYKAKTGNNLFGLKYTTAARVPSASGYFLDGGSEQNADGSYTKLNPNTSKWCKFSSIENCVKGYFEFLTNGYGRYDNLKSAISPFDYLQKIRADQYATDLNYVSKVSKVINDNNLTQYDNNGKQIMNIIQQTSTHNLTASKGRKIEWIVLHYTAGVKSAAGAAKSVASWFANPQCKASADFVVDDGTIVQYNADPANYYSWAVGGSKYSSLSTSLGAKYYGIAKNSNTVSIEICSCKTNTSKLNATDTDWYFTDAAVQQAVKLTKYLMQKYNIDKNHIIMHHMITGKFCPNPWCVNESALNKWYNFLTQLDGNVAAPAVPQTDNSFKVQVLVPNLNIRNNPNGALTGKVTGKGIFTIVKEQNDWGLLENQSGWIYLGNAKYTKRL